MSNYIFTERSAHSRESFSPYQQPPRLNRSYIIHTPFAQRSIHNERREAIKPSHLYTISRGEIYRRTSRSASSHGDKASIYPQARARH